MGLFKARKEIVGDPAKKKALKMEVKIHVSTEDGYSAVSIAYVELNENLISSTDTPTKALMNEIETIAGEAYEKIKNKIDLSAHLTDGYWSEKEKNDL